MNDEPERRRRRRDPAEDVQDVFAQMREQMRRDEGLDTTELTDWGDNPVLRSHPQAPPEALVGPSISPEILQSLDWSEALVEGLLFVDRHTATNGHAPRKRRRLRHVLNMLNHFMGRHPELQGLLVRDDIATLGIALDALNTGVVHPLLATQAMNKPSDTKLDQLFRGYIVAFVTLLLEAGVDRQQTFIEVAKHLTAAGYKASRPTQKNPSTAFRAETVRRYFQRAQPKAEMTAALKDENADRKKVLGQHDSHVVGKLLDSFVRVAISDGETLPPSKTYARQVIEATLGHATIKALFEHKR